MNFKPFFLLNNRKKGVGLPQELTWQAGPGGADVERGTTAPLQCGTEATWQDACGPRVARMWR